jgi:hypothetical protein
MKQNGSSAAKAAGPGQLPVHGKGKRQPVGLDDAFERRDPVLRKIGDAARPQTHARFGSEQVADVEGQDAAAEMRLCEMGAGPAGVFDLDLEVVEFRPAIPLGLDAARRQDLPAHAVGDAEGQAAIGKAFRRRIHPVARRPARHDPRRRCL